jgi:hypothetical protein
MKQLSIFSIAIILMLFSSCGINTSAIVNHNANTTQVQLGSNNFKVLEKVTGSSEVSYVLIFGGISKKQLYENAYSNMMDKANLTNSSKAIINLVTEAQFRGFFPIYYTRTVTVSAHVIEFTK